jgi:hypothetical protein
MLILDKDKDRQKFGKNSERLSISIKLEDIYPWVEYSYLKVKANPSLICNCFKKAGVWDNLYPETTGGEINDIGEEIPLELSFFSLEEQYSGESGCDEEEKKDSDDSDIQFEEIAPNYLEDYSSKGAPVNNFKPSTARIDARIRKDLREACLQKLIERFKYIDSD